jgi:hypothetical protein
MRSNFDAKIVCGISNQNPAVAIRSWYSRGNAVTSPVRRERSLLDAAFDATHLSTTMTLTPILIRAAARGGKFLGPDAGGANFWIYNATTGDTYASMQNVDGDSGPAAMMTTPLLRDTPLPVDTATAGLFLEPDLDRPCVLFIGVEGPPKYPDQASFVALQAWVLPGVGTGDPRKGDAGLVIDIPGICIDVQSFGYDEPTRTLSVTAAIMMMCGCKVGAILPGLQTSPWPPSDFDVELVVGFGGGEVQKFVMTYSGTPSIYKIAQTLRSKPAWAMITVSQQSMGQSGACPVFGEVPAARPRAERPHWIDRGR